jgi:hypothetical protein
MAIAIARSVLTGMSLREASLQMQGKHILRRHPLVVYAMVTAKR